LIVEAFAAYAKIRNQRAREAFANGLKSSATFLTTADYVERGTGLPPRGEGERDA
jgi:hypothetical protein